MAELLLPGGASRGRAAASHPPADFMEWLASGRLRLVDRDRQPVTLEEWDELPQHVQENALADFRRLVTSNTSRVVIFLRP